MANPGPPRAHTLPPTPLSQQVGGHAGIHVTEDESLLLKPALPREIAFYQSVRDIKNHDAGLHLLRSWIPKFFGLLSLVGELADPTAEVVGGALPAIVPTPGLQGTPGDANGTTSSNMPGHTLVLQNLLYGYRKPCILDVKLGTVLHDEDASEEKKARMIKKAANSTTLKTGMRLTGFQVSPSFADHTRTSSIHPNRYIQTIHPTRLYTGRRMGMA